MKKLPTEELERLRKLADALECVLEDDLQLLGDVEPGTTGAWRKRGDGPPYLRFGKTFLYPVREARGASSRSHSDAWSYTRKRVAMSMSAEADLAAITFLHVARQHIERAAVAVDNCNRLEAAAHLKDAQTELAALTQALTKENTDR